MCACVQKPAAHKEDMVVSRYPSLPHHAMVRLPTAKHMSHVFTDGNGVRLSQSNLNHTQDSRKRVNLMRLVAACHDIPSLHLSSFISKKCIFLKKIFLCMAIMPLHTVFSMQKIDTITYISDLNIHICLFVAVQEFHDPGNATEVTRGTLTPVPEFTILLCPTGVEVSTSGHHGSVVVTCCHLKRPGGEGNDREKQTQ